MSHTNLKETKSKSCIFNKNINNKYKLIPFNVRISPTGETKYFPSASKEWKNSVYSYNQNTTKNFPVLDSSVYSIIKNYFNLYFNHNFIFNKLKLKVSRKAEGASPTPDTDINEMDQYKISNNSYQKIFVSKPEIKHTNSKALITIYTYNKQAKSLLKKIKRLDLACFMDIMYIIEWIRLFFFKGSTNFVPGPQSSIFTKTIKYFLFKELILIRRLKLKLDLNKYKFEEKFLYKLSKLISRFYNKKVVFNIVNLKYVMFNSDIFTEILSSKLKNIKARPLKLMKTLLNKAKLSNVNRIQERTRIVKAVNFDLMNNRFRDININNLILSEALDAEDAFYPGFSECYDTEQDTVLENILIDLYHDVVSMDAAKATNSDIGGRAEPSFATATKNYTNIYNTIFNSINYKNINGVRLEVKGRLTRRFRADKAVFKLKLKGGLRNIDSSYKGLSSVNLRGFTLPNVESSCFASKRRVGAFAVKGWVSGKS